MKKIVHYIPNKYDFIQLGSCGWVNPVDHTSPLVSNNNPATTSEIIRVESNGVFETLNSIYVPEGVDYEIYR